MVKFNTAHQYRHMCRQKSIPSHVPVKDLSPQIYMMNYLTAKMIIIINNEQHLYDCLMIIMIDF